MVQRNPYEPALAVADFVDAMIRAGMYMALSDRRAAAATVESVRRKHRDWRPTPQLA